MKILHVISDHRFSGLNRELNLLLTGEHSQDENLVIRSDGRSWLPVRQLWSLAASLREFQPDQIVAWGLTAFRTIRLALPSARSAIFVRKPQPPELRGISLFDRWLLRRADGLLVSSESEAARCVSAGLPPDKICVVRPGVRPLPLTGDVARPSILCAGALEPHKGFYEAVWAFDILHFPDRETEELTIAGEGPERRRLEGFVARAGMGQRVHLPGFVPDIAPLLASSSLVWVPSLCDTGAGIALEAMAAGVPVIASHIGALAEIIVDGETGILVEPNNKMELARQTRRLLLDPELRRRLGEAGRVRALQHYSSEAFIRVWNRACTKGIFNEFIPSPARSASFPR